MKHIIVLLSTYSILFYSCLCFVVSVSNAGTFAQQSPLPPPSITSLPPPPPPPKFPEDQNEYWLVLSIENTTDMEIDYEIKKGDDKWESVVIKKKESKIHSSKITQDTKDKSFDFFVKFYKNPSEKKEEIKEELDMYKAPEGSEVYAKKYYFYIADKSFIELSDENKGVHYGNTSE